MTSIAPVEILRTKLYRPRPPERLVERRRLLQQLEEGLNSRVALVMAPAGYGKTMLISSWLDEQAHPACWLSLDSSDNDLAIFLTYLIAAVQTLIPGACAETAALLSAMDPPPLHVLQTRLVNELDLLPDRVIIVVDDYHLIDCPEIHETFIYLVNHLPSNIHLLISTRQYPPFPLAVWRARQQMSEVRTRDLCFTAAEAEKFLKNVLGDSLSADTIKIFHEEAEGWITGLQLAAYSLRNAHDSAAFVNSFKESSSQNIREFLLDQVFVNQPRPIQEFLLKTSILKRFSAPLCNALGLSGESLHSTQDTIDILHRANLFIAPLDEEGEWFRYHYLFAEMLQRRLKKLFVPAEMAALHRSAAQWFAAQGYIEEAIEHALAAGEEEYAARIVEQHIFDALNHEKLAVIHRWLVSLPPALVETRPRLMMVRVWFVNYAHPNQEEPPILLRTQAMLETMKDNLDAETRQLLDGYTAALWSMYLVNTSRVEEGAYLGEHAWKILPPEHYYARGRALVGWALCMQALGKGAAVEAVLLKEKAHHSEVNAYTLAILYALSSIYLMNGKLFEMEQAGLSLYKDGEAHGFQILAGWGYISCGMSNYLRNNLQQARQYFERAAALQFIISRYIVRESMVGLILTLQNLGDVQESQDVFKRLSDYESGVFMEYLHSLQARLALARGDLKSAQRWSLPDSATLYPSQIYIWTEVPHLTQARIWIAEGKSENLARAVTLLRDLKRVAESMHCSWRVAETLILMAEALYLQGKRQEALTHMEQAVQLARPGQAIRLFVDAGPCTAKMLAQLESSEPDFVQHILAAFDASSQKVVSHPLLTPRELEVLQLLGEHMSEREIAEQLTITLDTVKKHCYHIYNKLGVSKRRDAVALARELGILP